MTTSEMIAVMQAQAEGARIESSTKMYPDTWRHDTSEDWDWVSFNYRVATVEPTVMLDIGVDFDLFKATRQNCVDAREWVLDCGIGAVEGPEKRNCMICNAIIKDWTEIKFFEVVKYKLDQQDKDPSDVR